MKKLVSRKEYEKFIATMDKNYCPLCDTQKQILLSESTYWLWIAALSPYWCYHTMIIPKRHILDIDEIKSEEFVDFQKFHTKIINHLLTLNLKHEDDKIMNQFILMIRTRKDAGQSRVGYYKPQHLHIHICPDREGVDRFKIDPKAIDINIEKLAL